MTPTYATKHSSTAPTDTQTKRSDAVSGVDSSTFGEGVKLLGDPLQADVRKLYSVLRTIDDLVDENDPIALQHVEAIERWAICGEVHTKETRILAELSRHHQLPTAALLEFCAGMRHDLSSKSIQTEADLERYCQQAGGSVGLMLAALLGTTHPEGAKKLAILGRAMQRTNILRDIDEDRAHGRIYIAQNTIERFGAPEPGTREPLLRDQIARADRLYDEGLDVIPTLIHGRQAMALATALYREILRQIERTGYGRQAGRVDIPEQRKHELAQQLTS